MIYLESYQGFITNQYNFNPTHGRIGDLIRYFEKNLEEKQDELPGFFHTNYPNVLDIWCSDNSEYFVELDEYDSEEDAMDNIVFPDTPWVLEEHYIEAYEEYKKFLVEIVDDFMKGDNPYELEPHLMPLYLTFNFEGVVENGWMVHFTLGEDTQKSIIESGYFLGVPNMDNLAISAGNEEEWVKDGYCFGYDLNDVYYNFKNNSIGYGEYGVLFRASGIKLYHNGDEEHQTIFIGNQVSDLIPFDYDRETNELHSKDNSIRTDDIDNFFEKLVTKYNK